MFISEQAEEIFSKALTLDEKQRAQYLNEACGSDASLRKEVDELITIAIDSEDYFNEFTDKLSSITFDDSAETGTEIKMIGPWRLLRLLGSGGMGSVYLAERADRQYERRVALKLLSSNVVDPVSRYRFQSEKRILAKLQHENIAHFIDGGVTESGSPYIVLEYIDGLPVDEFYQQNSLDLERRLKLFLNICDAVDYAHRNLVIHRDIKPANILVTKEGLVKLLDFGIAKMKTPDTIENNLTQHAFRPLTPAYSSPEMLRGDEVDVSADIFSLGAVLYELICERKPASSADGEGDNIQIPPPSKVAQSRAFSKKLKGDLDTIILKSLHYDKERRFDSVRAFANDIKNYLNNRPVSARPESVLYQLGKFVVRHKFPVLLASVVLASLVIFSLLTTRFALESERQNTLVSLERDRAETTKTFLLDLLKTANPDDYSEEVTVRQLVTNNFNLVKNNLDRDLRTQSEIVAVFSDIFDALRDLELEKESQELQLSLVEQQFGKLSPEYSEVLVDLSNTWEQLGDFDKSIALAQEVLDLSDRSGNELPVSVALTRIGRIYHLKGDFENARLNYERALGVVEAQSNSNSMSVAAILSELGHLETQTGNHDQAEAFFLKALDIRTLELGDDHPLLGELLLGLARTQSNQDREQESIQLKNRVLSLWEKHYGSDNSYSQFVVNSLGVSYKKLEQYSQANGYFLKAVELVELHNPGHPSNGFAYSNLADTFLKLGEYQKAEKNYSKALEVMMSKMSNHHKIDDIRLNLGITHGYQANFIEAERLFVPAFNVLKKHPNYSQKKLREAAEAIANIYIAWGKLELAKQFQQEGGFAKEH